MRTEVQILLSRYLLCFSREVVIRITILHHERHQSNFEGRKLGCLELRRQAEVRYYSNPPVCLWCKNTIPLNEGSRVCEVMKKKFYNRSCAASHNNSFSPKRNIKICPVCETRIKNKKCKCDRSHQRIGGKTKGELVEMYGKHIVAVHIRQNARFLIGKSGVDRKCKVCGYDKHINVCHKKAIKDYIDASCVDEINNMQNIALLCPNHHWEMDNGILSL